MSRSRSTQQGYGHGLAESLEGSPLGGVSVCVCVCVCVCVWLELVCDGCSRHVAACMASLTSDPAAHSFSPTPQKLPLLLPPWGAGWPGRGVVEPGCCQPLCP